MCKQHGTAILDQFTRSLFGLSRPHNEDEAVKMAENAILLWTDDPRRIRSAFGRLAEASNEARRLAALPESDPHRHLATAMVTTMDELAGELKKSRQLTEIINELIVSLSPRQAATA